jgi:hypothetical protein
MRNVEKLMELVAFMEMSRNLTFAMDDTHCDAKDGCGSAGCIAGFAATLWPEAQVPQTWKGDYVYGWDEKALRDILGMTKEDTDKLFWASNSSNTYNIYDHLTKDEAIEVVRTFAETGEVVWPERFDNWGEPGEDE